MIDKRTTVVAQQKAAAAEAAQQQAQAAEARKIAAARAEADARVLNGTCGANAAATCAFVVSPAAVPLPQRVVSSLSSSVRAVSRSDSDEASAIAASASRFSCL